MIWLQGTFPLYFLSVPTTLQCYWPSCNSSKTKMKQNKHAPTLSSLHLFSLPECSSSNLHKSRSFSSYISQCQLLRDILWQPYLKMPTIPIAAIFIKASTTTSNNIIYLLSVKAPWGYLLLTLSPRPWTVLDTQEMRNKYILNEWINKWERMLFAKGSFRISCNYLRKLNCIDLIWLVIPGWLACQMNCIFYLLKLF